VTALRLRETCIIIVLRIAVFLLKKLSQLFDGICDDDYQLSVVLLHCANSILDVDATTRTTELRLHDDQIDGTACIYRTFCNGTNGCDHGKENTFFNCFWVSGSWHHKTS
jgi:hypothetical protein